MGKYVIVDYRPYDLPEVYGPYKTREEAEEKARKLFQLDTDDLEFPDGIVITVMRRYV